MNVDLTGEEIATIKEYINYSKKAVSEAHGTSDRVGRENLARYEAILNKLRRAGKSESSQLPPTEAP